MSRATIEHLSPAGLPEATGYSHVVTATGGKTVYVAGQGAFDASMQLVGAGDHYAQTRQAYRNLMTALEAAGATCADVVKSTIYVAASREKVLEDFARAMNEALGDAPMPPNASTYVGVERLAYDGMLVEIDAIAVVHA